VRCNLKERLIKLVATGFGCGLAPALPGTVGTLPGIPLYLLLTAFGWPAYLLFLIVFTGGAVYIAQAAEGLFAAKDPPRIVIDEVAGFLWTMFLVPPTLAGIFFGFIFFRFFDIVKPYPIRLFQDKLPGGYGVVADDVMAGIYSNLALHILMKSPWL